MLVARSSVDLDVEGNKQNQVRGQDEVAVCSSQLGTITVTHVWQVWEVLPSVVGVGGKVNEDQVQHKLDDLESGDPLLPPHLDATRTQEVVPVHDDMDSQVQRDRDPLHSSVTSQLGVAQQGSSTVVVDMQEQQLLLLQHQENCVDQLPVLGQVVQVVQGHQLRRESTFIADSVEQAIVEPKRNQLLDQQQQQEQRGQGQTQVMQLEDSIELQRWGIDSIRQSTATKDDDVVNDNNADSLLTISQKGLVVDEPEVLSWVSDDLLKNI